MTVKLSILVLTHNRPALFDRCIKSIITHLGPNVNVIVNNDSNDITEVAHPSITYHYNKFDNISAIYEFLLGEATGDYVYFAEDDDYLHESFGTIDLTGDLIMGNYYPTYAPNYMLVCMSLRKDAILTPEEFTQGLDLEHLQLSQFIFKRSTITDFVFPQDNNIHNDINLVLHATTNCRRISSINKIMFYQTTDGGDNISFPETTSKVAIDKSLGFLDNYEIFDTAPRTTRS
jgi:glycosyltransferase involved in cell wall biosynthesis